jgi:hypothetical protein
MESRNSLLPAAALMMAALFAYATDAAAQAKEGTWKGTYAAVGTSKATAIGKDRLLLVFDENGLVTTNGGGIFDHTTWHCWGLGDFTNGVGDNHGYCVGTDPTGDQAVLNFASEKHPLDQKITKGSFTLTGGTGKYAGITGTASFTDDGAMFKTTEGTYVAHNTTEGTYKLP